MVAVTVFTHAGRAVGFLLKGHAGYGEQGEDLACAGISAITQTALLGITDVLKIKAKVTLEEGVKHILENIDYWKKAPVWTPDTIKDATADWFKYLSK